MSELLDLGDRHAGPEAHDTNLGTAPDSAIRTAPVRRDVTHEHGWRVESRHRTSLGEVLYVRCATCGTRRVDLHEPGAPVPRALSRAVQ